MNKERADLGFSDAIDDLDLADWTPKPTANDRPPAALTEKAAEAAGFKSREPKPRLVAPPAIADNRAGEGTTVRRRRTGRNAQLNLKVTPESIQAFTSIADRQGWGLGETFEYAIDALNVSIASKKPSK